MAFLYDRREQQIQSPLSVPPPLTGLWKFDQFGKSKTPVTTVQHDF